MQKSQDIDVNQIQSNFKEYDDFVRIKSKNPLSDRKDIHGQTKEDIKSKFSDWQKAQLDMYISHK